MAQNLHNTDDYRDHMRLGGPCPGFANRGFGWKAMKETIARLGHPSGNRNTAVGLPWSDRLAFTDRVVLPPDTEMRRVGVMKDKYGREMITVCDACLTASCWYGEHMCQASQGAGTVNLPIETLRGLGREHEDYWHRDADGRPGKYSSDSDTSTASELKYRKLEK